jgi:SAM-dependent methyltransferase
VRGSTVLPVPSDWYVDFFTELPNEFWRRAVAAQATAQEVDFIVTRLRLPARARILDVPCGSGRHTLELAARGHDVSGVDISTEAIDHARRAAARAGLCIALSVGELRSIPRDGSFDAAICMGNSFGYLDLSGTREFVAALARAIRPGGGLVIDYAAAAESVLPGFIDKEPRHMALGDITVTGSNSYNVTKGALQSRYVFSRGEQRVEATALHHVYSVAQVCDLLRLAGFADITFCGGPNGEPFELRSSRLLLSARRV